MSMTSLSPRQTGLTLIELILFIVIVGAGLAGILSAMTLTVQYSADPLIHKQATALADSIMEEILLKSYQDPDGLPNTIESGRETYDDVDDYDGLTISDFGDLPTELSSFTVNITVTTDTSTLGVIAKKITVAVTGKTEIRLTSYRTNY